MGQDSWSFSLPATGTLTGRKPVVFLFSGQGSHYYGMGKELYATHWRFRHWMDKLDEIAKDFSGQSIVQELYSASASQRQAPFNDLRISHPAIFIIQFSLAQTLIEDGIEPDIVFGSSLGEIVAAAVAGVLRLEDAILLVLRQAYFFSERANDGGMIAVLAGTELYENTQHIKHSSCIASYNFDRHFVLSGTHTSIAELARFFLEKNIVHQILDVPVAFHSKVIDHHAAAWNTEVEGLRLLPANIPMVSPAFATLLNEIDSYHFWDCVRLPIQFSAAARKMLALQHDFIFIDVSPSNTSAGFLLNLGAKKSNVISVMNMYGRNLKSYADALNQYQQLTADSQPSSASVYG